MMLHGYSLENCISSLVKTTNEMPFPSTPFAGNKAPLVEHMSVVCSTHVNSCTHREMHCRHCPCCPQQNCPLGAVAPLSSLSAKSYTMQR